MCLVFSGTSPSEQRIDLSKLNRVTFGEHSVTISSSKNQEEREIELLYSLFHHLEVREAFPDILTGAEELEINSKNQLRFLSDAKCLVVESDSARTFSLGIFDLNGNMMLKTNLSGGDHLSLESLLPAPYVAVATDGTERITIKFILN